MAPQEASQPEPLIPTTLGGEGRQAGRKRKTNPQNPENAKKCRGYREQQKKAVQGEKDDLESLERENRELVEEETALKNQLERMRETYLGFINEGRLVWQDDALEGGSPSACCSMSQASSGYSSGSPYSSCSSPEDSRLRRPSQESFASEHDGFSSPFGSPASTTMVPLASPPSETSTITISPPLMMPTLEPSTFTISPPLMSPTLEPSTISISAPFMSPASEPSTSTISPPFLSPAPEPNTFTVCVDLGSPETAYLPIATPIAGFLDPSLTAIPAPITFHTSADSTVIVEEINPTSLDCYDVNVILQLTDSLILPTTLDTA